MSTNLSNRLMRSFVWSEFLSFTREDDARRWRMNKSTSLGMPPWHPPGHSRRIKRLSLGMPKSSPLLHRQPSDRLRWNYFFTLYRLCVVLGASFYFALSLFAGHVLCWILAICWRGSHVRWETPRGRYDAAKQQFHLLTKPWLSDPVGLGEGLARCQSNLALVD